MPQRSILPRTLTEQMAAARRHVMEDTSLSQEEREARANRYAPHLTQRGGGIGEIAGSVGAAALAPVELAGEVATGFLGQELAGMIGVDKLRDVSGTGVGDSFGERTTRGIGNIAGFAGTANLVGAGVRGAARRVVGQGLTRLAERSALARGIGTVASGAVEFPAAGALQRLPPGGESPLDPDLLRHEATMGAGLAAGGLVGRGISGAVRRSGAGPTTAALSELATPFTIGTAVTGDIQGGLEFAAVHAIYGGDFQGDVRQVVRGERLRGFLRQDPALRDRLARGEATEADVASLRRSVLSRSERRRLDNEERVAREVRAEMGFPTGRERGGRLPTREEIESLPERQRTEYMRATMRGEGEAWWAERSGRSPAEPPRQEPREVGPADFQRQRFARQAKQAAEPTGEGIGRIVDPPRPPTDATPKDRPMGTFRPKETFEQSSHQIIQNLAEPITRLRIGRQAIGTKGTYWPKTRIARAAAKESNNLYVAAHELGHHIGETLLVRDWANTSKLREQLENLGIAVFRSAMRDGGKTEAEINRAVSNRLARQDDYFLQEGEAHMGTLSVINRSMLEEIAPDFAHVYRQRLGQERPDWLQALDVANREIEAYRALDPESKIHAHMVQDITRIGRSENSIADWTSRQIRHFFNEYHALNVAVEGIAGREAARNLPPGYHAGKLAQLLSNVRGRVESMFKYGVQDVEGRIVPGTSIDDMIHRLGARADEFNGYLIARGFLFDASKGRKIPVTVEEARAVVDKYRDDPLFQAEYQTFRRAEDAMLDRMVGLEWLSAESAATMRDFYHGEHVPLRRLYEIGYGETLGNSLFSGSNGMVNLGEVPGFMHRRGSTRPVIKPIQSLASNMMTMEMAAQRNRVGQSIVNLSDRFPDGAVQMGLDISVRPSTRVTEIPRENIERIIKDLGFELKTVPEEFWETVYNIYQTAHRPSSRDGIFVVRGVWENAQGERAWGYRSIQSNNRDFLNALMGSEPSEVNLAVQILSYPAQALRATATAYNPLFGLRNFVRDALQAAVIGKGRITENNIFTTLSALGESLVGTEKFRTWRDIEGGNFAGFQGELRHLATEHSQHQRVLRGLNPTTGERVRGVILSPFRLMRYINETLENATRYGQYKSTLVRLAREHPDWTERQRVEAAVFESRDFLDFSLHGSTTQAARLMIPFLNANAQGISKITREFRGRPGEVLARAAIHVALPSAILYLLNRDNDDYWARPESERFNFWHIPLANGDFAVVPKPFQVGQLGTLVENTLALYDRDNPGDLSPYSLWQLASSGSGFGFTSAIPTSFLPVAEGLSNYDFFYGRSLYSPYLDRPNVPAEFRRTRYTTRTAQAIASITGAPAAVIDNYISDWGAVWGQEVTRGIDELIRVAGNEPVAESDEPYFAATRRRLLRKFVRGPNIDGR